MMDLFNEKNISPMLIAQMQEAFDDPGWIYELKLDGCRCLAYLENGKMILRNKRNMELLPRFPELAGIHESVKQRCVLDGELVVLINSVPDFYELQKRTMLTNQVKITLGAKRFPDCHIKIYSEKGDKFVCSDCPEGVRKKGDGEVVV